MMTMLEAAALFFIILFVEYLVIRAWRGKK